jgi:hypothetical protein
MLRSYVKVIALLLRPTGGSLNSVLFAPKLVPALIAIMATASTKMLLTILIPW